MAARFSHGIGMAAPGDIEPDWRTQAACRGGIDDGVWFPTRKGHSTIGKRICGQCPVKDDCLHYALDKDIDWGIWGGLDRWDLKKLRNQLGITPI